MSKENPTCILPSAPFSLFDTAMMQLACYQAMQAKQLDEVPVGAVVVLHNQIIGVGFNRSIQSKDPSAHAEMVAIRQACLQINNYRLTGATLYVTLEPCLMCLGAIMHARIKRVLFGALEPKTGVFVSQAKLADYPVFPSQPLDYAGGLLAQVASRQITQFFQQKRKQKR